MPSPVLQFRVSEITMAALDAKARALNIDRSELARDIIVADVLGYVAEPQTGAAMVKANAAKGRAETTARDALHAAEARTGVRPARVAARLDTSSVPVFAGGKRPAYQKGGGTKPKVRG